MPPTASDDRLGLDARRLAGELAGLGQPFRLLSRLHGLARGGEGGGRAVVVLPGHGFDDRSTAPLRGYLRRLGYDVRGWELGANRQLARTTVPRLAERLEARVDATGAPVALVGQSLGGFVAREVARQRPDLVARVVTLGAPLLAPTSRGPIERPVLALFSRRDQVVPVSRATDDDAAIRYVEVGSTHFAMGVDPDVWRLTREELALDAPAGPGEGRPER